MQYQYISLLNAHQKDFVSFEATEIKSRFNSADRERMKNRFILLAIGVIALEMILFYFFPIDQTIPIFVTLAAIFIGGSILSEIQMRYETVGTIFFHADSIEFIHHSSNASQVFKLTELVHISSEGEMLFHLFGGKNPQEVYFSFKVCFHFTQNRQLEYEILSEISLKFHRDDLIVKHCPHLEAVLKAKDPTYKIVDEYAFKNQLQWDIN